MTYQVAAIEITDRCLCSCPGCFSSKGSKDMSYKVFEKIIDRSPQTITRLEISGGEPLLNKELPEMIAYASTVLAKPQIFTSGTVWNKPLAEDLAPCLDAVKVTLKYPDERDDQFKHFKGSFEKATGLLRLCRGLGLKTYIQWTVERANLGCYEQMKKLASELGAELLVYRYMPFDGDVSKTITREEFFRLRVYPPTECPAGVTRYCVMTSGEVTPCIYIRRGFGNLLEEPFDKIAKRMQKWRTEQGKAYQECIAYKLT